MPNNLSMMLSLYVTLGVFFASRTAQSAGESQPDRLHGVSSFAYAAVMGAQALRNMISRGELIGVAILVVIGAVLIAVTPAKQPTRSA